MTHKMVGIGETVHFAFGHMKCKDNSDW